MDAFRIARTQLLRWAAMRVTLLLPSLSGTYPHPICIPVWLSNLCHYRIPNDWRSKKLYIVTLLNVIFGINSLNIYRGQMFLQLHSYSSRFFHHIYIDIYMYLPIMDFSVLVFITPFMSYCWAKASPSDHRKDASPHVQRFFYIIPNYEQ